MRGRNHAGLMVGPLMVWLLWPVRLYLRPDLLWARGRVGGCQYVRLGPVGLTWFRGVMP